MDIAHPSPEGPPRLQESLDAELSRAEIDIYLTTVETAALASAIEARATAAGLSSRVRRARLLRSDALSRQGRLAEALRLQLELLTEAELDADRLACARAQCLLASTYDRLAEPGKALLAAEEGVRMLAPGDPRHWPAEHMMVLAVCTSYWRHGTVDYTTFDESLRLARELGEPLLLLAILNNYAYISLTHEEGDQRGQAMTEEMRRLVAAELGLRCPSTWLDTIAVGLLQAGRLDEAAEISAEAAAAAPRDLVEPSAVALCILTQARVERARGNLALAGRHAQRAADIARDGSFSEAIGAALEELSELAALDGDHRRAYELLRERNAVVSSFQTERSERHAVTLQAIYAVEVERQQRLALEALADTDPLTGLYNRRYMNRRLGEMAGSPLTLALLDIDHFKQVNDTFSHAAGDRVLVRLAGLLRSHAERLGGPGAFVARIGGEEFVLAMPAVEPEAALACCERMRAELESASWDEIAQGLRLTVSVGLAFGAGGEEPSALLGSADANLYAAKRQGRNRVSSELSPERHGP